MNWLTRLLSNRSDTASLDAALRETLAHWHALPPPELGKSHFESRYVVLNTQSTGVSVDKDHVLAVAAIALDGGALDPADSYFSPLEPDPATALTNLLTFCGGGPIVVYNASLNRVMLERALDRHLGVAPQWLWLDLYWLLPTLFSEHIDTPTKLADWMRIFAIDTFERRHALGDAYAIAQLMLALQSRALKRGMVSPRALSEAERGRRQASGRS
jgi:DNA polymerase III subunit epsilon